MSLTEELHCFQPVGKEENSGFPFPSQDFVVLSYRPLTQLHPTNPACFFLKQIDFVTLINSTHDLAILFMPFSRP